MKSDEQRRTTAEERGALALAGGKVTVSRHHSQSGWVGYMLKMPAHCIDEDAAHRLAGLINTQVGEAQ